ncbi:phage tail tip fiber protein [Pseudomonas entomophila]|uniref:phage tail tip fiber protein n=1 Tax=Pseudomonas entomophila TaxID=312306 RepID=UPI003EBABB3A
MSGGVKKIAQVAVGAVIGFIQGGPMGAAIGAGLAFYASEQQEKLNTKSPLRDNEPSAQTVRSSKAPVRFILGKVSTGGVLVWAQEEAGKQRNGEWLHLVYVLCEGAVDGLEEIYLGEEVIKTYGTDATYELVVNPTQVNAFLKANCPDWKDEQIGRGLSFVRLSLRYNAEKFPSGIPDARFIVRGRNDLYDPRTGLAGYSENTALHILWFLRTRCGVPDDEIIFETFASGANVCDELVANPDGTSSLRYRSSCVIGADEQRTNVLQKLEAACGGKVIRVGGRWMFQAGAYYGPWDFEITEDMVIGTITGSSEPTNDAAINTIRGTFIDTTQSWAETDYPEVTVAEWVVADGGEAAETLTFSYVTDPYQAQRLANIELRRRRAGGVINVPLNLLGYNCRPGRAVRVNLPSLNILGEFIVTNWSMGTSEGCTAALQVYDPAIFDDAVGKPYNPIGFIGLPSSGLGSPTGLAWRVDDTSEVTQGVLSWVAPAGIISGYVVTVRQAATAVRALNVPETTTQVPLAGLPSGHYTMSVAALGPQARSGEASITVNINGPAVPEACTVESTIDTITLFPSNVQHGLNGGTYEYFYSMDPQATADRLEYLGQGLSLTHTGLAFFTNYFYFVRSKNAYGVSSFLKVPASTSTDVSTMLAALRGKIERGQMGEELGKELDDLHEKIETLDGLKAYDQDEAYEQGQMVVLDDRIYQAKGPVAADASGANAPPNPALWEDVGQSIESANGLAQQVATNTVRIEEVDGKVTATAESLQVLRASSRTDGGEGDLTDALQAWDATAAFASEVKVNASREQATALKTETLESKIGANSAKVQMMSETVVGLDGKVSAISSWKTETNVNGKRVATGIVQGSNGDVGEILLSAQRVAIINGIDGPEANLFVFQDGRAFINAAFINKAFIQELILGMTLRSQATDAYGRPLLEINVAAGTFALRSQDASGSTLINNGGVYVYDENNVRRTAVGRLS